MLRNRLRSFRHDESAASMVEYGILVALVAAISIAVIGTLGEKVKTAFQAVVDKL